MKVDAPILLQCKQAVEAKLGWGDSQYWTNVDFETFSDRVLTETGVSLSVSTLKRLWGKVQYSSSPQAATLNALARFIEYPSFRDFEAAHQQPEQPISAETPIEPTVTAQPRPATMSRQRPLPWRGGTWGVGLFMGLFLSLLIAFSLRPNANKSQPVLPTYSFSSRPVTRGIPNSVVFHYDATSSPTDSVFIQQSWDPKRRQLVPKDGHEHTSLYYLPGYYRAKLVVGRQTVREHDVIIQSDGWLSAVSQEPVPVYLDSKEAVHDGVLNLPAAVLERHNIPMQPHPPVVNYAYVRPLNGLRSDNFIFETRVKNEYRQGAAACQTTQITILCRDDLFSFPLCAVGCVGNLNLYMAGHRANSKHTNLSAFGTAMSQWVDVRLEVRNKRMKLFINGKKAYQAVSSHGSTEVLGIQYAFLGTGSVDRCRFTRTNGEVIFDDEFDSAANKLTRAD